LSTILKRVREFYREAKRQKTGGNSAGGLLPAWPVQSTESPAVSFSDIITAYQRDPACKAFVDFLADQAVGMGFFTTVSPGYEEAEEAKRVVDDFCEAVNLDGLLQVGAREIVACGNSFWLKIEPDRLENLKILPVTAFDDAKAIVRDQYGEVERYNYSFGGVKTAFQPEKIIHFRWNPVNFGAFGVGLLQVPPAGAELQRRDPTELPRDEGSPGTGHARNIREVRRTRRAVALPRRERRQIGRVSTVDQG